MTSGLFLFDFEGAAIRRWAVDSEIKLAFYGDNFMKELGWKPSWVCDPELTERCLPFQRDPVLSPYCRFDASNDKLLNEMIRACQGYNYHPAIIVSADIDDEDALSALGAAWYRAADVFEALHFARGKHVAPVLKSVPLGAVPWAYAFAMFYKYGMAGAFLAQDPRLILEMKRIVAGMSDGTLYEWWLAGEERFFRTH